MRYSIDVQQPSYLYLPFLFSITISRGAKGINGE